jgi:hypothetical protein
VRLTTSSQVGSKVLGCVCAGSALQLAEDESTSIVNVALVGVLLSQSASPSVVTICFSPDQHNLGFLTEGKLVAILIIPSSWGSQRASYSPHIRTVCYTSAWHQQLLFWHHCRGRVEDFCEGSFLHTHPLLCYCFALLYLFYLHHFISKTQKKLESLVVIFTCLLSFSWNG